MTIIQPMSGRTRRYELVFAPQVVAHLPAIEAKYHGLIRTAIEEQLTHTPEVETRNRKPIRQPAPFAATWELRFGPDNRFRVFYEVNRSDHVVWVLAIGVKEREQLLIGGKELEL